jgi:hypothetical protein
VSLEPLCVVETSPGKYSLILREPDVCAVVFEAAGHSGNGYSWEAVARHLLENELEPIADPIDLDSEADLFCASGPNRKVLERLGERLAELARHPKRLAKVVAAVPPWAWDDG